jgi:hypothetical protein
MAARKSNTGLSWATSTICAVLHFWYSTSQLSTQAFRSLFLGTCLKDKGLSKLKTYVKVQAIKSYNLYLPKNPMFACINRRHPRGKLTQIHSLIANTHPQPPWP